MRATSIRAYPRLLRVLGLTISGCTFTAPAAVPDDGGVVDGTDSNRLDSSIDTSADAFDDKCFGSGDYLLCLPQVPAGDVALDAGGLDTTSCTRAGASVEMIGATSVCVIDGANLAITNTVGVFGQRPLVLVATGTITIATGAVLDAASLLGNPGPGANSAACTTTGIDGAVGGDGGGGGAGGSFGSQGGGGGAGVVAGGIAAPVAATPVTALRGGCRGGVGSAGVVAAPGGDGGGAVYLVARGAIIVNGRITASGAGGAGGVFSSGGGSGAGSGGMIVFHAGTLTVSGTGRIVANGGGGGASASKAASGQSGANPDPSQPPVPAPGGPASITTASGGNGATKAIGATNGGVNLSGFGGAGGGGGGGGVGVIRVLAGGTIPGDAVSPVPTS